MALLGYGAFNTERRFKVLEYVSSFPYSTGQCILTDVLGGKKVSGSRSYFEKMMKDGIVRDLAYGIYRYYPAQMFSGKENKYAEFYSNLNERQNYIFSEPQEEAEEVDYEFLLKYFIQQADVYRDELLENFKIRRKHLASLMNLGLITSNRDGNKTIYSFEVQFIQNLVEFHDSRRDTLYKHFLQLVKPHKNKVKINYEIESFEKWPEFYRIKLSKKKKQDIEFDLCVNPALRIMRYIIENAEKQELE